jgi:hypothetical protein
VLASVRRIPRSNDQVNEAEIAEDAYARMVDVGTPAFAYVESLRKSTPATVRRAMQAATK